MAGAGPPRQLWGVKETEHGFTTTIEQGGGTLRELSGTWPTAREAAVAHDVLQQIAWAGGPSTVQPPLNYPRSSYESLPLFRYLRDTCSLADACRLLREGLLEDLLGAGKQRLRRHATLVPQPPRGADIPVGPAAALGGSRPLAAARCKRQVDGAGAPGAKRSKTSHAACDQPPKLRSTWAEIPAGSGAYLVNLTERTLRMREISVPGFMRRSKLFKKASHGASVTLASADTDERWLGDYVEYQRPAQRSEAMLRGLGDLFADCSASVHTVLQFSSPGADGLIHVRAFPADSKTAEDFMTYLRTEARGPSSSGQKHTPQQRAAAAPSPDKENASPCKARAPAAEQDMPTPGRVFGQALANSQRSAAASPSPGPLLGSPARGTPLTTAPPARPGLCAPPAGSGTCVTFSRPKQFPAECPPGNSRQAVTLSASAIHTRSVSMRTDRGAAIFGVARMGGTQCIQTVAAVDASTGVAHRYGFRHNAENKTTYLKGMGGIISDSGAAEGDVLLLEPGGALSSMPTACVTLKKGSKGGPAMRGALPGAKRAGASGEAAGHRTPQAAPQPKAKPQAPVGRPRQHAVLLHLATRVTKPQTGKHSRQRYLAGARRRKQPAPTQAEVGEPDVCAYLAALQAAAAARPAPKRLAAAAVRQRGKPAAAAPRGGRAPRPRLSAR